MTKPFLKWAGGKSKLVPLIQNQLPTAMRLVEPFAGSAAVTLALEFDAYLLNDSNADLIGLYQTLKQEKQDFIDYAQSFFTLENNQETRFYDLREQFNHSTNTTERSALFIYLNRHAFNGLCRYNSKGGFNVPFGRYKLPYFHLLRHIRKADLVGKIRCVYCNRLSKKQKFAVALYYLITIPNKLANCIKMPILKRWKCSGILPLKAAAAPKSANYWHVGIRQNFVYRQPERILK